MLQRDLGRRTTNFFFWAYCSITWTTIGKTSFINVWSGDHDNCGSRPRFTEKVELQRGTNEDKVYGWRKRERLLKWNTQYIKRKRQGILIPKFIENLQSGQPGLKFIFYYEQRDQVKLFVSILASATHYGWNDNVINIRLTDKRVSFSSTLGMANIL